MKKILSHVDSNMNNLVSNLQTLIRQPSVSAKNEGIEECANLVKKMLQKAGINSQILRLGKNIPPVVYGEIKSKKIQTRHYCSTIITMSNLLSHLIYGTILHLVLKSKETKSLVEARQMIKVN